jgi:hypothetical protein
MFSKKDYSFFIAGLTLIIIGYTCMAYDPVENGFGVLTLWIAPPVLLLGFMLPIGGILGIRSMAAIFSVVGLKGNRAKHVFGLLAFLISFLTYLLTLEPTASLWDCSEFIASAFKLQVPHTPGTPLSLLIGRVFTLISFGDVTRVAWSINVMSALFSALAVFLIYHIIYYFGEKFQGLSQKNHSIALVLAALCGSLCLAFSDTFWFSAVEAEAYGPACFFLLLIVWLILKGKDSNEPLRSRLLVLIFYISGLAYCIHPMCLLALPVLPLSWYVNNRSLTVKNSILLTAAGLAIVFLINRLVAIGLFELAFSFDLFFVNSLNMPFYSGAVILIMLIISLLVLLLKRYFHVASYTWSLAFLILGFAPYLLLFIRSNHNPPIDENNPENLAMIKAYMNRESYPSSPLIYGPYFDAQVEMVNVKKTIYHQKASRYEVSGTMPEYEYQHSRSTILPRLYSNDADHIESYKHWTGLKQNEKPRFSDNLKFMFGYQLGHMYLRYFMWNFAGRVSDHQSSPWLNPWHSRNPIENNQTKNKARNQYWMIPLTLGMIGILFQYKHDRKGFSSVTAFFLITGIILALYLNSTPNEPRERDYIYVGSYVAFCIWIGLGFFALLNYLSKKRGLFIVSIVISIITPAWMFYENYDDHNRSGRTFQVDNASNVLNSCAPNSILFTGGDNDTFPLWYLQEVEGYRTDVRVVVLSYFNTDWYINQLRKRYYQSEPFNLTLGQKDYRQYGPNDVLYVQESIKEGIDVKKYLQLLKAGHKALRMYSGTGDAYSILPSRTLKLKVEREKALNHSASSAAQPSDQASAEITFHITGNYLQKNALAVLDLMTSNNWERPVYFNFTSLNTVGIDLNAYVVQEGNVYRFLPAKNEGNDIAINTSLMYTNLIEKADYSNLTDNRLYFNYEDYQARIITPIRQSLNTLAVAFLEEGNHEMAEKVLIFSMQNLYLKHLLPSYTNLQTAELLQVLGKHDFAKRLCLSLFDFSYSQIQTDLSDHKDIDSMAIYLAKQAAEILSEMGDEIYLAKLKELGLS